MEKYKQILEGLLFLSGDEGLCMTQLLGVFQDELTQETLETLLDEMMKEYMEQARGFELVCYQMKMEVFKQNPLFKKTILSHIYYQCYD